MKIDLTVQGIIECGRLLWDKDLVGGYNGNISIRDEGKGIWITGRGTCLGFLDRESLSYVTLDGVPISGAECSSETPLHLAVYKAFSSIKAIVHTHTTFTNAFFLKHDIFTPETFEAEYTLGSIPGVMQEYVNVVDMVPVIEALQKGRMVALRKHGILSPGDNLFDCVVRIQVLEEQMKMAAVSRLFALEEPHG